MKPTFGSAFAGIGGFELGLERAGWECRWQIENDKFCNKILEDRWLGVKRYGEIEEVNPEELEAVNLICGGFPCQPVSTAGQKKGKEDTRWLWPELYRIICGVKPKWVLVENVPGLYSIDLGRLFGGILRDLAKSGYDAEWDCIPAAALGALHLRYRVFLVAHANGQRCENTSERHDTFSVFGGGSPLSGRAWALEPNVGRMANGVPSRVDRLKSLGNAVVPQVAEWIGRRILEHGG